MWCNLHHSLHPLCIFLHLPPRVFFLSLGLLSIFLLLPCCRVVQYIVSGSKEVVSLIPLSRQTSPSGKGRADFLKSGLSRSGTSFAFRLNPTGTPKADLWTKGTPSSLRHKGISYCQARPCYALTITNTHTAVPQYNHYVVCFVNRLESIWGLWPLPSMRVFPLPVISVMGCLTERAVHTHTAIVHCNLMYV